MSAVVQRHGGWLLNISSDPAVVKEAAATAEREFKQLEKLVDVAREDAIIAEMAAAIAAGAPRNGAIIQARNKGLTLERIGDHIGVTRERIRQICEART
jgi:DNA-directed RNA polymerase sigma subunit (sigma70/sigma32)